MAAILPHIAGAITHRHPRLIRKATFGKSKAYNYGDKHRLQGFDMHKNKRYRNGPSLIRPRRGGKFIGLFWLIGLAVLFSSGRW
jgi:hypothetical protein